MAIDVKSISFVNPILLFFILLSFALVIYWILFGEKRYKEIIGKK